MPFDTIKTTLQVEGNKGVNHLIKKAKSNGPQVLYHGGGGAYLGTLAGHGPWFLTYNWMNKNLSNPSDRLQKLMRNAFIGFSASAVSDTMCNS